MLNVNSFGFVCPLSVAGLQIILIVFFASQFFPHLIFEKKTIFIMLLCYTLHTKRFTPLMSPYSPNASNYTTALRPAPA